MYSTFVKAGDPVRGAPYEYMVRSAFLRAVRNTSSSSYTEAGSTGISVGFAAFCSIERPYKPEYSEGVVRVWCGERP